MLFHSMVFLALLPSSLTVEEPHLNQPAAATPPPSSCTSHDFCRLEPSTGVLTCLGANKTSLLTTPPSLHDPCAHRVKVVNLSGQSITTLRRGDLSTYTEVNTLHLDQNQLREVEPGAFESCSKLKYLFLGGNHLKEVRQEMFKGLDALTFLDLSHNQLDIIVGESLRELTNLRYLDLSVNAPIRSLQPNTFQYLPHLTWLHLNDLPNLTQPLPSSIFEPTPNLEEIYLINNSLPSLPSTHTALKPLVASLTRFSFGGNNLVTNVSSGALANLTKLELFELVEMPHLKSVDRGSLWNTPNLLMMYLVKLPALTLLHPQTFHSEGEKPTRAMEQVTISHTGLRWVSKRTLAWDNVGEVRLEGNPWHCACNMSWMSRIKGNLKDNPTCKTPPEVAGRSLLQMSHKEFSCTLIPHHKLVIYTLLLPLIALFSSAAILTFLMWKYNVCKNLKNKYYTPMYISMYNMEIKRGGGCEGKEMSILDTTNRPLQNPSEDNRAELDYRQKGSSHKADAFSI